MKKICDEAEFLMDEEPENKPPAGKPEASGTQTPPAGDGTTGKGGGGKKEGRRGVGLFLAIVFNLTILGSVGFIGYMVYEQDKAITVLFDQQNSITGRRDDTGKQIIDLQTGLQSVEAELTASKTESAGLIQQQKTELERLRNELTSTRLRINDNKTAANQEWLLAEAASLLRLAQQQMIVARSARTAQALYLSADDILKQIDDPAIFSVRETLAGELAAIRAVPEIDIQGLYLQLGAVAEQLGNLHVNDDLQSQLDKGEQVTLFSSGAGEQTEEEAGFFSRLTSGLKSAVNNYITVRRRDVPVQPLLTSAQEFIVVQNIRLQIEQARTALLRGQQEIFTGSLSGARAGVDQFLAGDPALKDSVLMTLDSLIHKSIVPDTPPLTRTRVALDRLLSAREQQPADAVNQ